MTNEILFALWFFLPAGVANAAPVFMARIPGLRNWNAPLDFNRTFRGQRIFGSHKTWRGLLSGMVLATVTLAIQQYLVAQYVWAQDLSSQVDYDSLPLLVLGPLFGLGALGGDAIESFFKRQRGVQPGHGWFPFDQTDYIIGGAIASMPFVQLSVGMYAILIVLWLAAHVIASYIGYLLGLKERPI